MDGLVVECTELFKLILFAHFLDYEHEINITLVFTILFNFKLMAAVEQMTGIIFFCNETVQKICINIIIE